MDARNPRRSRGRRTAGEPDAGFRVHSAVRPFEGTFADVELQARRLAAGLRKRGVGPGDVVALQLPNWVEAAASFWASAFLGAVVVPIVHFYGRKELEHILATARPKVFITAEEFGRMKYQPDLCADVPIVGLVGLASAARELRRPARRRTAGGHDRRRSREPGIDRLHLGHHQQPEGRRPQPPDARLRDAAASRELPARPGQAADRHPGRAFHRHARRLSDPGAGGSPDRPVSTCGIRARCSS